MIVYQKVRGEGSLYEVRKGVWECYFSLGKDPETGKYIRSQRFQFEAANKSDAKRIRDQYRRAIEAQSGEFGQNPGIVDYARAKFSTMPLSSESSELGRAYDIRMIEKHIGNVPIGSVTAETVNEAYRKIRIENTMTESGLKHLDGRLRQVFKLAMNDRLVVFSPMGNVPRPKPIAREREFLDAEDIARVKETLEAEPLTPRTMAIWILVETGMRVGEMLGLEWGHVDLAKDTIYIEWQYTKQRSYRRPKTRNSVRKIAFGEKLHEKLVEYREQIMNAYGELPRYAVDAVDERDRVEKIEIEPVVFASNLALMDLSDFGTWFRHWSVEHGFGHWGKPAEIVEHEGKNGHVYRRKTQPSGYHGLSPHLLRHAFGSALAHLSVPPATTQFHMGHSSYTTTNAYYTHQSEAAERNAIAAFERATG